MVSENGTIQIDVVPQYTMGKHQFDTDKNLVYEVKFGQLHVTGAPRSHESDDSNQVIFPHEARLRNLTYATDIYVDVTFSKKELDDYFIDCPKTGERKRHVKNVISEEEPVRVHIGKVPVMIRSKFCQLY